MRLLGLGKSRIRKLALGKYLANANFGYFISYYNCSNEPNCTYKIAFSQVSYKYSPFTHFYLYDIGIDKIANVWLLSESYGILSI